MNIKNILMIGFITIVIILATVNIPNGVSYSAKKNLIDSEKNTMVGILSPLEKSRNKILSAQFLRNTLFNNKDGINLQYGFLGGTIHTKYIDV